MGEGDVGELPEELAALGGQVQFVVAARWVWLTPTDTDEQLLPEYPPFSAAGISWRAVDHAETAAALLKRPEAVIDTLSVTRPTPDRRLFEPDGVHLTSVGQVAVARVAVAGLSQLE
ncbi:hypothetical protein [Nocardia xishanensis]